MAKTFLGLLPLADLSTKSATPPVSKEQEKLPKENGAQPASPAVLGTGPGLHYNIQIHLPATKDVEVYNAIFKSLREHLFEQ